MSTWAWRWPLARQKGHERLYARWPGFLWRQRLGAAADRAAVELGEQEADGRVDVGAEVVGVVEVADQSPNSGVVVGDGNEWL
ncbi:hypothetical protein AB0M44_45560 [Streptosporangium subroseum]|uniref:hypothetical protein n=1 Tax=Streptosporangium subroseum TaxID=106412 RepID=UPI00343E4AFC